ncbi:MAG: response regulator transcription factor, partial [Polyangiales bacterium]
EQDSESHAIMLRILLVDDHVLLRRGLALLLDARPELTVVGEFANGREAVLAVANLRPDVVIMDVAMPTMDGLQATKIIRERFPLTKVVILSAYGDPESLGQAIAAGASAFIIKRSDIDELALALQLVSSGNTYFSRELAEHLDIGEIVQAAKNRTPSSSDLTPREREILQLIAEGHTMRAIASMLVISAKTVEGHNGRIMAKVAVKNRADLVRYAIEAGLVRFDAGPSRHAPTTPETSEAVDAEEVVEDSDEYYRAS